MSALTTENLKSRGDKTVAEITAADNDAADEILSNLGHYSKMALAEGASGNPGWTEAVLESLRGSCRAYRAAHLMKQELMREVEDAKAAYIAGGCKGSLRISRRAYLVGVHPDYRSDRQELPSCLVLEPGRGTILVPVEFTDCRPAGGRLP